MKRLVPFLFALGGVAASLGASAAEMKWLVPDASQQAVEWRWTTATPGTNWNQPAFDDAGWKSGPAGFGTDVTPGAVVGTTWDTAGLWLRKSFEFDGRLTRLAFLRLHHDDAVTVYLNGMEVFAAKGFANGYAQHDVSAALLPALKPGRNVLAVQGHQDAGGQFVDVGLGLSDVQPPPPAPKRRANVILDAARDPNAPCGLPVRMIIDMEMRDANITTGPDGTFYLVGTTADPNRPGVSMWEENNGIYMWRSKDLTNWTPMGLVWDLDKDATWSKAHKKSPWVSPNGELRRAVWAPEIHYIKGNWWIPYCMNYSGTGLLKSQSGKPEGPYRDVKTDGPLTDIIDATLFEDDDGKVYMLWGGWWIVRMTDDMTALAEAPREVTTTEKKLWGEGSYLRKIDGKYHLVVAGTLKNTPGASPDVDCYDCYIALSSESPYGPYSGYYRAIPHGGHNNLFQDKKGDWWSSFFCSDPNGPWFTKPGVVALQKDKLGRLVPRHDAPLPKWKHTNTDPGEGWMKESFSDDQWTVGEGAFGDLNPLYGGPTTTFGTGWKAGDVWLRRSFEVSADKLPAKPQFYVLCSGPAEIFVNGRLAARVAGPETPYRDDYQWLPMEAAVKLRAGRNTIAVHGQAGPFNRFLDVGLVDPL